MFKIGEFSKLVRVSPRMLRHYEKCGLLYPAGIDKFTGYRQYSASQIPLLTNIVLLRDVGFSIDEIGDILPHMDDKVYMEKILRAKAVSVKAMIDAEQNKYDLLIQMSDSVRKERNVMAYDVKLEKLPSVKVLTLRGTIPHYRDEGILWEKLGKFIDETRIECHSGGYSTYFDEEYKEENPDVEIAIPVDVLGTNRDEFIFKEYTEIELAATVRFSGPFDGGYDAACAKLAEWMEQNNYTFAGPLRGHVIEMPEFSNPESGLTELQAPVLKRL